LFGDFIEGRWGEKRGEFHETLRGHVDAGRITHGWAHAASSAGGVERMGEPPALPGPSCWPSPSWRYGTASNADSRSHRAHTEVRRRWRCGGPGRRCPTIADRVAQTVVAARIEAVVEPVFHGDSYGYWPGRSALDAVGICRERCWDYD